MRFVLGAVIVGFQRPQLDTVCVVKSSTLPLGIVVLIVDTGLIAVLLTRVASSGLLNDISRRCVTSDHGCKLFLVVISSGVWTAVSDVETMAVYLLILV